VGETEANGYILISTVALSTDIQLAWENLSWTNYPQTLNEPNGYNQQITKPQKICPGQKKSSLFCSSLSAKEKEKKTFDTWST
jgi:hypothetical protein